MGFWLKDRVIPIMITCCHLLTNLAIVCKVIKSCDIKLTYSTLGMY